MKKIVALFLMLVLALSGSGCSDHSPAANGEAGKLNIYMLNDNQNVRDAIACYAAAAPDVESISRLVCRIMIRRFRMR